MNRLHPRHAVAAALLTLLSLGALSCRSTRPEAPQAAPPAADPEKEVLAQQARRIEAMIKADAKVLDEILRDDLTYIHSSGPLEGKAQVLDEIVTSRIRYRSLNPSEQTVRVYGDTVVVTGRAQIQAQSGGKVVGFPIRFTEVWVRAQGVWRLAAWQSTRIPGP